MSNNVEYEQGWAGNDLFAFPFLAFAFAGNARCFLLPIGKEILLPAKKPLPVPVRNCCRKVAGKLPETLAGNLPEIITDFADL